MIRFRTTYYNVVLEERAKDQLIFGAAEKKVEEPESSFEAN